MKKTTTMTALDRTLAKTFRAARWEQTGGKPVCRKCFDGEDLVVQKDPIVIAQGLQRYHCTVCNFTFSDLTDTIFFTSKSVPLARWAYLTLLGDPARLEGLTERQLRRCWELAAKIKTAPLTQAWREQLEAAGITVEKLKKQLAAERRAA